jgi:hypothetical protein
MKNEEKKEILKHNLELLKKASREGDIYIDENGVVWVFKRKENKQDGETIRTSSDSI